MLSAAGSEAAAPALAKFLYPDTPKEELTQEQKDTITNIITLSAAATTYTTTNGDVASSVSAAEVGKGAVENNYLYHESALKNSKLNNRQRRHIELLKKLVPSLMNPLKQNSITVKAIKLAKIKSKKNDIKNQKELAK